MTAGIVHCQAVVLRNLRFGETSRVATLFTLELGKLGVMAKGSRDPRSPFGASLEILTHSSFVLYYRPGRDLQFVKSGSVEKEFRGILRSSWRYVWASAWVEFLDRVLLGEEPAAEIFALALRGLSAMESAPEAALPEFFRALQLRTASLLGYAPRLERCLHCGRPATGPDAPGEEPDAFWYLRPAEGGVLCPSCAASGAGGDEAVPLRPRAIRRLRAMASGSSAGRTGQVREQRADIAPSPQWLRTLDRLVEEYLRYHLESYRGLRSLDALSGSGAKVEDPGAESP